ncbi:hypothetical protein RUM44_009928 [Polyplax serrata]
MIDPSELIRHEVVFADKKIFKFRDYNIDPNDVIKERVRKTYFKMHKNMTVEFVKEKLKKWSRFDKFKATVMDTLYSLNNLIDESDPDLNLPNIVHAFQTAERIRKEHPNEDWFHLTGLIHDLGKVMAFYDEPQWCVVGDTFPVGCQWAESIVYRENSFDENIDGTNEKYNTKYGMYMPNCGLDNLMMSWGHDEYLYRVLKHNNSSLPEEALTMIRYHSFYPWHSGGDYWHLCNESDKDKLKWVLEFNKYDLYTKSTIQPDIEALKPYYQNLMDKYIPGTLKW